MQTEAGRKVMRGGEVGDSVYTPFVSSDPSFSALYVYRTIVSVFHRLAYAKDGLCGRTALRDVAELQ